MSAGVHVKLKIRNFSTDDLSAVCQESLADMRFGIKDIVKDYDSVKIRADWGSTIIIPGRKDLLRPDDYKRRGEMGSVYHAALELYTQEGFLMLYAAVVPYSGDNESKMDWWNRNIIGGLINDSRCDNFINVFLEKLQNAGVSFELMDDTFEYDPKCDERRNGY